MLLDALFRSEPLENPSVPVTGEAAETDNIFARDVYVSPETSMRLAAVYACIYVISSRPSTGFISSNALASFRLIQPSVMAK